MDACLRHLFAEKENQSWHFDDINLELLFARSRNLGAIPRENYFIGQSAIGPQVVPSLSSPNDDEGPSNDPSRATGARPRPRTSPHPESVVMDGPSRDPAQIGQVQAQHGVPPDYALRTQMEQDAILQAQRDPEHQARLARIRKVINLERLHAAHQARRQADQARDELLQQNEPNLGQNETFSPSSSTSPPRFQAEFRLRLNGGQEHTLDIECSQTLVWPLMTIIVAVTMLFCQLLSRTIG